MSIFGKLAGAVVRSAILPVAVAKDALTLGGACTDQDIPYTAQAVKKIARNVNDVVEEIEEP